LIPNADNGDGLREYIRIDSDLEHIMRWEEEGVTVGGVSLESSWEEGESTYKSELRSALHPVVLLAREVSSVDRIESIHTPSILASCLPVFRSVNRASSPRVVARMRPL
jgi:hypothetical protein